MAAGTCMLSWLTCDAGRGLFYVNYELQGKLGEGAFGEARLARRRKVRPG